jgi:uncharacterized protein (TIGR00369 family)
MTLVSLGKNSVKGRMPWTKRASQWNGLIHGGALAALADTTAGVGTIHVIGPGWRILTAEMKINFFGNIPNGSVDADGKLLHRGSRSMVWEVRLTPTGKKKLLAISIITYIILDPKHRE